MQFKGSLEYLRSACAYIYGHMEDFSFIDITVNGKHGSIAVETQLRECEDEMEVDYDEVRAKFCVFMAALDDDTINKICFTRNYCSAEVLVRDVAGQVVMRRYEFRNAEPVDVAPESITELA